MRYREDVHLLRVPGGVYREAYTHPRYTPGYIASLAPPDLKTVLDLSDLKTVLDLSDLKT